MRESRRWSLRAAGGLGLTAFGVAFAWNVLDTFATGPGTLRDGLTAADLAAFDPVQTLAFVGAATVAGAVVGGPAWLLLVERWDRWSITRRGALAGATTGCLAVPVAMALIAATDPSRTDPAPEALLYGFLIGLFGVALLGWTTIPAGTATGYVIALWRADDATPMWRGLVERVR